MGYPPVSDLSFSSRRYASTAFGGLAVTVTVGVLGVVAGFGRFGFGGYAWTILRNGITRIWA